MAISINQFSNSLIPFFHLPKHDFAANILKTYIPDRDSASGEQKGINNKFCRLGSFMVSEVEP